MTGGDDPRRDVAEAFDQDASRPGALVSWFRLHLASAGVTAAERQAVEDVMARHEARPAERVRPDCGISWRL